MAYQFGGPAHSDQTLDHVPEFKARVDGAVRGAKAVVYIGWRPNDSGYGFFDWLVSDGDPPLTLVVEAWKPNCDAFELPYTVCFKVNDRAEFLFDVVPRWMRDCVVWQDGPEHLPDEASARLIKSWQLMGFKSIVVSTPDGYLEQGSLDGNELERHVGAWTKETYKRLNFQVESYSAGLLGIWQK
jgi:hypothetical protein